MISLFKISFVFLTLAFLTINAEDKKRGRGQEHFKKMQKWHAINLLTYAVICDDKEITSCANTMTPYSSIVEALKTVQIADDLKSIICMDKEMRTKLRTLRNEINESFKKVGIPNQDLKNEEIKAAQTCLNNARKNNNPSSQPNEEPNKDAPAEKELKDDTPVAVVKADDNATK